MGWNYCAMCGNMNVFKNGLIAIALINELAYEYVLNSNEILAVERVRKVVGLNISNTHYSGNVIKSRKASARGQCEPC